MRKDLARRNDLAWRLKRHFVALRLDLKRRRDARKSACPGPHDCKCTNGIGCIHVPYGRW